MKSLIRATLFALAAPMMMAEASAAAETKVKFCKKEYDLDTGVVSFAFGNGETVELDTKEYSEQIRNQLMLHGISQKGGDSYAGVKGNYAEAIANLKEVHENLKQGVWKAAPGEGDARPRLAELAEAIARLKSVPLDKATSAVEAATDDQRKEWRSNAKVKHAIAQIRAEKAAAALKDAGDSELHINLG